MRHLFLFTALVSQLLLPSSHAAAQETITPEPQVTVLSPSPGQALQGTILISGEIILEGFLHAEVSFSYADDDRDTWFVIHEFEGPEPDGQNVEWNTTTLTDGEYNLRIIVTTDEEQSITYVPGLRVRNYTAIETDTPVPTSTSAPADTPAPTMMPTLTTTPVPNTATPLPPNPAQLNSQDITMSLAKGGIFALGILAIFGIYQFARNRRRRDE